MRNCVMLIISDEHEILRSLPKPHAFNYVIKLQAGCPLFEHELRSL